MNRRRGMLEVDAGIDSRWSGDRSELTAAARERRRQAWDSGGNISTASRDSSDYRSTKATGATEDYRSKMFFPDKWVEFEMNALCGSDSSIHNITAPECFVSRCAATWTRVVPLEPTRCFSSLTPLDHLRRFYRFCKTRYKHNIDELRLHTTDTVRKAMLSLASSHEHPDLDRALKVIENGGRKVKGTRVVHCFM
ncbi:hypothetical protein DFH09DRAFT_1079354 [Mycena vulgaris]|nr:hypothetical protein DFH09DRAFT_1079354 [Mycena vulgaris]